MLDMPPISHLDMGASNMPLIPRDPDHDIDAELRRMIAREEARYLTDAAPVWASDDPDA